MQNKVVYHMQWQVGGQEAASLKHAQFLMTSYVDCTGGGGRVLAAFKRGLKWLK